MEQWCRIEFESSLSNPCYYGSALFIDGVLVDEIIIPDTITTINNYLFKGCTSLTSVIMPDSVTLLGDLAFSDCTNLNSINIPYGITSIPNAFTNDCKKLTSVEIPTSVTNIGDYAFSRRDTTIIFKGTMEQWSNVQIYNFLAFYNADPTVICTDGKIKGQLAKPTISLTNNMLTITGSTSATSYSIYIDGMLLTTVTDAEFDLSTMGLSTGSYAISVKAKAVGYTSSVVSASVTYTVS